MFPHLPASGASHASAPLLLHSSLGRAQYIPILSLEEQLHHLAGPSYLRRAEPSTTAFQLCKLPHRVSTLETKITLLKLHVKEEKRENTRPHPARSHRWEREAGGTRKNLPRGPRAPRSRARSQAVGRQPRAGPSEKPLGAAPIPKTQRKAAAPTQALKREVSPSDSQTLTASGEALPQSLLGLQ